jgi:splicing factor U2AF subunit
MNASQLQNHFDAFYEDFWCEMCKYGELEEVVVCDNNNDREFYISRFECAIRGD